MPGQTDRHCDSLSSWRGKKYEIQKTTWGHILALLEEGEDGEDEAEQQRHEDPAHHLHVASDWSTEDASDWSNVTMNASDWLLTG